MKRKLQALASMPWSRRARDGLRLAALAPLFYLAGTPAFAAITPSDGSTPTLPTDALGGQTAASGDILGGISALWKQAITISAYAIIGISVLSLIIYIIAGWRAYSGGRQEIGEYVQHVIVGAVVCAIIVALAAAGLGYIK